MKDVIARFKTWSMFLVLFFVTWLQQPSYAEQPVGSKRTFRFAVTDIVGLEELQREFEAFQQVLSEKTGFNFELFPVTSRTVVVEAFRSKKLDFALSGPAEYVIIRNRSHAVPVVGLHRPDYYSVIVTRADSEIEKLTDLKGRKVAFGDHGSTAYHLAPLQVIKDAGLDPERDIKSLNISKQVAWRSFVRGQVDAIGMNQARFSLFVSREADHSEKDFRIIARSPDLPSDLIMAAGHVPTSVVDQVRVAFEKHGDEILQAILVGERNQKYQQMEFISGVKDSDYQYVRTMYQTAGYSEFAKAPVIEPSTVDSGTG